MKVVAAMLLDEIVRRLVAALQPEMTYLYGLHAQGQPHEDSDVDLLIVVRKPARSPCESAREIYRALRGLCVPVEGGRRAIPRDHVLKTTLSEKSPPCEDVAQPA